MKTLIALSLVGFASLAFAQDRPRDWADVNLPEKKSPQSEQFELDVSDVFPTTKELEYCNVRVKRSGQRVTLETSFLDSRRIVQQRGEPIELHFSEDTSKGVGLRGSVGGGDASGNSQSSGYQDGVAQTTKKDGSSNEEKHLRIHIDPLMKSVTRVEYDIVRKGTGGSEPLKILHVSCVPSFHQS